MAPIIAALLPMLGKLAERFIPDPAKAAEMQLELLRMEQSGQLEQLKSDVVLAVGQMDINKVEAANPSLFVSGWRPAAGWAAVSGLFYQTLFRPIGGWIMQEWLAWNMPPSLEIDTLMTLLFGMLGLGAYRTYEKKHGVAR